MFAEPRDACSDLTNAEHLTDRHVLLVNRGNCTYGTKAKHAVKTKSKAVIVINNEPGLEHLPGPDAHDINYSISSIPQPEGILLERTYDEGPADGNFGRKLEGYMVPINCESSGSRCFPATYEERRNIKTLVEGGTLTIRTADDAALTTSVKDDEHPLEYLLAHFGSKIMNNSLPIVVAKPADACSPIENNVQGKIVLVRRGGCPFVKKAENIQAALGRAMVVGSGHPYIVRMGVEPRWKGLNTGIPILMVSKRTYSILVAESYTGGMVAFNEDNRVNSDVWDPLEKLYNNEGWPRSDAYVQKKVDELLALHSAYPDRVDTINQAYIKKTQANSDKSSNSIKQEL